MATIIAAAQVKSEMLTTAEAAEMLGIQPQTLNLWRCTGRHGLPFVRVGRSIRYRVSDLTAWLDGRTATSTGALAAR